MKIITNKKINKSKERKTHPTNNILTTHTLPQRMSSLPNIYKQLLTQSIQTRI